MTSLAKGLGLGLVLLSNSCQKGWSNSCPTLVKRVGPTLVKRVGYSAPGFLTKDPMEPAAKRLRGWQKDMEKEIHRPLPKGSQSQSALCTKLLQLWSTGRLSAAAVQELAHCAVLDGADHVELGALAKSGNFGNNKGSIHRDLMVHFCPQVDMSHAHDVLVSCIDPKSGKETTEYATILLPHVLFWNLSHNYPSHFEELFKTRELEEFWLQVEKVKDDRLLQHPFLDKRKSLGKRLVVGQKATSIPLFVHGDGAEFQNRDSLLIWSYGSLLNKNFQSLSTNMLLACFPKSCTTPSTWDPIHQWLTWSFRALIAGKHPDTDPFGHALPKGTLFQKLQGKQLTPGGYRACIWNIQGDNEFYSNVVGLNHWQAASPCWECDCMQPVVKKSPCPKGKCFKILDPKDQKFEKVDTAAALAKGPPNHMLFSLPGVTTRCIRGDGLHILYCKGVCSHLCGSILYHFLYHEGKGKQKVSPSDRLSMIFQEIQEIYKRNCTPTRLTNLKLSMILDVKKPHSNYPKLEAKGAETKHFCKAFLPILKEMVDKTREEECQMLEALESLCHLIDVYDEGGRFLTPQEFDRSMNLAQRFFLSYDFLNKWALSKGLLMFNIVFKFHTFMHLVESGCHMNPRESMNFRSEDFVGQVSRLGHSCSMGVRSTRLSSKIIPKYLVLLHFQLTRPDFNTKSSIDE